MLSFVSTAVFIEHFQSSICSKLQSLASVIDHNVLSVTRVYSDKMTEGRIVQFALNSEQYLNVLTQRGIVTSKFGGMPSVR